jgi:DNA-damage-inducible protein J
MVKTATVTARVSPDVKASADALFSGLGLNTSEAISIFLHRALACRGLPFDVAENPPYADRLRIALAESARGETEAFEDTRAAFERILSDV